jgi:hypothetical protein
METDLTAAPDQTSTDPLPPYVPPVYSPDTLPPTIPFPPPHPLPAHPVPVHLDAFQQALFDAKGAAHPIPLEGPGLSGDQKA